MSRLGNTFCEATATRVPAHTRRPLSFDIFVGAGFNGYETSAITETLSRANQICSDPLFKWRFVSDKPGLIEGANGMLVRGEPAINDHALPDVMIVVGGRGSIAKGWMRRLRQMQRKALSVVLLSDAATAYISGTQTATGHVTTHWHDAAQLNETGYYPNLTNALSEKSDGIITACGGGATVELVIGLVANALEASQVAELGNHLLLPAIRSSNADQPKTIASNQSLFDRHVTQAIELMEASICDPLSMSDLAAQIGLSTRQLERIFREAVGQPPGKFCKRIRTRRARTMIEETLLPLADVAAATGFGSCGTMSKAVRDEFGITPAKMRTRRDVSLLRFA